MVDAAKAIRDDGDFSALGARLPLDEWLAYCELEDHEWIYINDSLAHRDPDLFIRATEKWSISAVVAFAS